MNLDENLFLRMRRKRVGEEDFQLKNINPPDETGDIEKN